MDKYATQAGDQYVSSEWFALAALEAKGPLSKMMQSCGANAAKIKKGSATPNRVNVGSITKAQLEEIASIKLPDLNTTKISSAIKIVEGTARNMGISVTD